MALSKPWTVVKGKYDRWSKVSVSLADDSRSIMGAEITMSEKRSASTDEKTVETKFHGSGGTRFSTEVYPNNERLGRPSLSPVDSTPAPVSLL